VEVTCRALHSRLLFRPSPMLNQIIIGTLGGLIRRSEEEWTVEVCPGGLFRRECRKFESAIPTVLGP
jgi:hypothetical protein